MARRSPSRSARSAGRRRARAAAAGRTMFASHLYAVLRAPLGPLSRQRPSHVVSRTGVGDRLDIHARLPVFPSLVGGCQVMVRSAFDRDPGSPLKSPPARRGPEKSFIHSFSCCTLRVPSAKKIVDAPRRDDSQNRAALGHSLNRGASDSFFLRAAQLVL